MAAVTRSMRMAAFVAIGQASATAALFVLFAQAQANHQADGVYGAVLGAALFAIAFSQTLLLVSWLTLGPGSWPARLGATFVFASAMALLYAFGMTFTTPPGVALRADWIVDGILQLVVVPLMLAAPFGWIARWWTWRWLGETTPPGKPTQFSLRLALLGTVVAALVLCGAQWLHEHNAELRNSLWVLPDTTFASQARRQLLWQLTFASLFASAGVGMAACCGPRVSLVAVIGALAAAPCLGLLHAYALQDNEPHSTARICGGATFSCLWMILTMLVLRSGGMRIDRPTPVPLPPPDLSWKRY